MSEPGIDEDFNGAAPDARLQWWNAPARAEVRDSLLTVVTRGGTDFWQRTHYGFRRDDGHCLLYEWSGGDFVLTTSVRSHPAHQYDQAGLIVRFSAECWLKTSIEYEPDGPNRLGVVVTNAGWSDWSTQDVRHTLLAIRLRIRRQGGDYIVESAPAESADGAWSQLRLAHLEDDGGRPVPCGLYACSPKADGFVAEFDYLRLESS